MTVRQHGQAQRMVSPYSALHIHAWLYTVHHLHCLRSKPQRGVTLIELLVTFAIFAVLVSLAVPSFSSMIGQWKRDGITRALTLDLQKARSESIKTSRKVVVCPSANASTTTPSCSDTSEWKSGWLVFVDFDSDSKFEKAKGDVLLAVGPSSSGVTKMESSGSVKALVFLPNGLLGAGKTDIVIEMTDSKIKKNTVSINQIGRVTVSTAS